MLSGETKKIIYSIIAIILFVVAGLNLKSGLPKKNSKLIAIGLILSVVVVVLYTFLIETNNPKVDKLTPDTLFNFNMSNTDAGFTNKNNLIPSTLSTNKIVENFYGKRYLSPWEKHVKSVAPEVYARELVAREKGKAQIVLPTTIKFPVSIMANTAPQMANTAPQLWMSYSKK